MEWDPNEAKDADTVDQRGARRGGGGGGGGGGGIGGLRLPFPLPRGKAGGGMGVLLVGLLVFLLPKLLAGGGFDLSTMSGLDRLPTAGSDSLPSVGDPADAAIPPEADPDRELAAFAKVLITDANDFWEAQFGSAGRKYDRTKLVLFSGGVDTGCGAASSDMGPFYCPEDQRVYVDLGFFQELSSRYGAAGDFAQAYVIAHEVGHHVQNELGISAQVRRLEGENPDDVTGPAGLSTRLELQADCLAGVWAHSKQNERVLDAGDIDEALGAAKGVGDDTIQRQATGRVRSEGFTHGSAAQRKRWFGAGVESGSSDGCDTFSVDSP